MRIPIRIVLVIATCTAMTGGLMAQNAVKKSRGKKAKSERIIKPASSPGWLDSIANNMVWVTGGRFTMGNISGEADEKPENEIVIDGFAINKYPVTQYEWKMVMGNNPSEFSGCDQCPVEMVSWNDAQRFIERLNGLTRKKYVLPTEAEWEYAAKGGLQTNRYRYSGSDNIEEVGWYTDNSGRHPHPVGEKKPNELGLYDMTGNVWEWCQDWYHKNYYESQPGNNPTGPKTGGARVRRGGSWFTQEKNCTTATRNSVKQDYKDDIGGFRLAQYPN